MAPTRSGRSRGQPYHQPTQPRHLVYHKLLHKRNRVQAPQPQSSSCMRDYAGQRRHHQQILRHVSRAAKAAAAVASANTRIVAHYSGVSRDYVLYRQQLQKYANTQKKKNSSNLVIYCRSPPSLRDIPRPPSQRGRSTSVWPRPAPFDPLLAATPSC